MTSVGYIFVTWNRVKSGRCGEAVNGSVLAELLGKLRQVPSTGADVQMAIDDLMDIVL